MNNYFTVLIPYVPPKFQTEWHGQNETGPLAVLSRGAFDTYDDAIKWARDHLNGAPYGVKLIKQK